MVGARAEDAVGASEDSLEGLPITRVRLRKNWQSRRPQDRGTAFSAGKLYVHA